MPYVRRSEIEKVAKRLNKRDRTTQQTDVRQDVDIEALNGLATTALQPDDLASGTITARTGDLDFSGGSDGDVWTVQTDGSFAPETPSGISDAPSDGSLYARKNAAWESFTPGGGGGAGIGGGWKYEQNISTTGGSQIVLDVTGHLSVLLVVKAISQSSAGRPFFRVSPDDGTTIRSGASDYKSTFIDLATSTSLDQSKILPGGADDTGTFRGLFAFHGLIEAQRTFFESISSLTGGGNNGGVRSGYVDIAEVTQSIIIATSAGTFDAMDIDVYVIDSGSGFIAEYSGTAQTEVDIPLTAGAIEYEIVGWIEPATDGTDLHAEVTNDGFTTTETGAVYRTIDARANTSAFTTSGGETNTAAKLATNIGNAASELWMGKINVLLPHETTRTEINTRHTRVNSTASTNTGFGGSIYNVAEAIDGIRLKAASGNIDYHLWVFAKKAS